MQTSTTNIVLTDLLQLDLQERLGLIESILCKESQTTTIRENVQSISLNSPFLNTNIFNQYLNLFL
jgi:hypothetical protein